MCPTVRKAVMPGSFDPPTAGHAEILRQAVRTFDEVIVAVAVNAGKTPLLAAPARVALLEAMTAGMAGVSVAAYDGLTARFARDRGARFLVRGVRDAQDLAWEREAAAGNRVLDSELITVLFLAGADAAHVSARLVREIVRTGGAEAARPFLPDGVCERLCALLEQGGSP